jgi:hypothetical protein
MVALQSSIRKLEPIFESQKSACVCTAQDRPDIHYQNYGHYALFPVIIPGQERERAASYWLAGRAGAAVGLAPANSVFYIGPLCIGILTGHIVGGAPNIFYRGGCWHNILSSLLFSLVHG